MKQNSQVCNISAYQFIAVHDELLIALHKNIKNTAIDLSLKGTILLSLEGINLFLAGHIEAINDFKVFLNKDTPFNQLEYKNSFSDFVPFKKLVVKIRNEIVTFSQQGIHPERKAAPYIEPMQLQEVL